MPTSTGLEIAGDAHIACYAAWLYPSDASLRMAAMQACYLAGVDYLEAVARTVEDMVCSPDIARLKVADSWSALAARHVLLGDSPRVHILATGEDAGPLGTGYSDADEGDPA